MQTFLTIVHILISLALIAGVLLQSGKGDGMSGIFGGGAGQQLFSKKKGMDEILTRWTSIVAFAFVVTSLVLGIYKF
ncbi:MAG: preprotein translocase subunit SecG [Bacillota bacterium]